MNFEHKIYLQTLKLWDFIVKELNRLHKIGSLFKTENGVKVQYPDCSELQRKHWNNTIDNHRQYFLWISLTILLIMVFETDKQLQYWVALNSRYGYYVYIVLYIVLTFTYPNFGIGLTKNTRSINKNKILLARIQRMVAYAVDMSCHSEPIAQYMTHGKCENKADCVFYV